MEADGCTGKSASWLWNAVKPGHAESWSVRSEPEPYPNDQRRRKRGQNNEFSMPAVACPRLTRSCPIDRSGKRFEILRCELRGLHRDVRGKEAQTPPPCLALPSPALKSGTFYFAEKGNFLLCVDSLIGRRTIMPLAGAASRPSRQNQKLCVPTRLFLPTPTQYPRPAPHEKLATQSRIIRDPRLTHCNFCS